MALLSRGFIPGEAEFCLDSISGSRSAGLVHALACEEKESGDDAGGHTGTHSRSATVSGIT
jgi:hypothetical protein